MGFWKKTFLSLALWRPWARERKRPDGRRGAATSGGLAQAMPPSEATGGACVARSHGGSMGIA